jgi:hypothetical protein
MQKKDIKELKDQASQLGRHLRAAHGFELSHAQLLEAMAALHNVPDWNSLQAQKPQVKPARGAATMTAQQHLEAAMAAGACYGDAVNMFAERQTVEEKRYANHARKHLSEDGELEFDDPGCMVSMSQGGAYVQGWYWLDELPPFDEDHLPTKLEDLVQCVEEELVWVISAHKAGLFRSQLDLEVFESEPGVMKPVLRDNLNNQVLLLEDQAALRVELFKPSKGQQVHDAENLFVLVTYQDWTIYLELQIA